MALSIAKGDTIVFRYLIGEKDTGSDVSEILVGKVQAVKQGSEETSYLTAIYDSEQEPTGEEVNIAESDILCNLFNTPKAGEVYGKFILKHPENSQIQGHKVLVFLPDTKEPVTSTTEVTEKLLEYWDKFEEPFSRIVKDKWFEVHIKEGEATKSNFSKKSKHGLDGTLTLFVSFKQLSSIEQALCVALSNYLWCNSPEELKSTWLTFFSEELSFDKLDSIDFQEKLLKFLTKKKNPNAEPGDEMLCKFVIKEIKRIKCLSLKDLKTLVKFQGESYLCNSILPEVLNMVKLKDGIRTIPLSNTNAIKRFNVDMSQYILTSNCVEECRETFISFLES